MPDEKLYTERDLILAKREAFAVGCGAMGLPLGNAARLAARRYELPKITRLRVVTDQFGTEWRMRENVDDDRSIALEYRHADNGGWQVDRLTMTAQRIKLWADLLANPTEEVADA
ncbi:MAG: hypothetical protein ACYC3L_01285 [Gemmatimonadaceae bacterium]